MNKFANQCFLLDLSTPEKLLQYLCRPRYKGWFFDMSSPYYDRLDQLLTPDKERKFFDRSEIIQILTEELNLLNETEDYFRVFVIHGIGGIGKSRLIKHFQNLVSNEIVLSVSFEIDKHKEIVNNLYRIRKEIHRSCPLFDYSLLRFWELTQPSKINEEFLNLFNIDFFTSIVDSVSDVTGLATSIVGEGILIPKIPTIGNIVNFINKLYQKSSQTKNHLLIKKASMLSEDELLCILPQLLGVEIRKHIDSSDIKQPVFIFDSYQESIPYSESEEWLFQLICSIGRGFFIITGRENVHWKNNKLSIIAYPLASYPEDETRDMLKEYIPDRPDLVETIITSTQCVPIYIDLALNIYEKECNIVGQELVSKVLFQDRNLLVKHFVSHLKPEWQDSVLDLAIVRLFNQEIFEDLSINRMIACKAYDYKSLIESNLFSYITIEDGGSLVKLHDVFCRDAQKDRPLIEQYRIFQIYLDYICRKSKKMIMANQEATLVALFLNVVTLACELEEKMAVENDSNFGQEIQTSDIEKILDIFFELNSAKIRFIPPSSNQLKTSQMKDVCTLICAKTYEKVNTLNTIHLLETINNPACFGTHLLSFQATLNYAKSLSGKYADLKKWLNELDEQKMQNYQEKWFYNQMKVYRADCDMMDGKFKEAYGDLLLLQNGYMSSDDYYTSKRTIGHIFRFNFLLEKAIETYQELLTDYGHNNVYKEYLKVNLFESKCYFPENDYISSAEEELSRLSYPYNIKNKAKLLYSLAIACIVKGEYKSAENYINKCIMINKKDGYISGILFAKMAQAYLEYARYGKICKRTLSGIDRIITQNRVYEFFRLHIAIIGNNDVEIKNQKEHFQWLDFDTTVRKIRAFLFQLRS